jgi:hypothetical protein
MPRPACRLSPKKDVRWRRALHLELAIRTAEFPSLRFRTGDVSRRATNLNEMLSDYFGFAAAIAAYEHTEERRDFPVTHSDIVSSRYICSQRPRSNILPIMPN